MQDSYYVQCCWTGRTKANEQIAIRAADWFRELSRIDPFLERWYLNARTAKQAVEVSPTLEVLRKLFNSKAHDRTPMGPIFGLWNGRDEPDACSTGIDAHWMTGGFPALCAVNLPWEGELAERMLTVEALTRILRAMVRVWEPDYGVAISSEFLASYRDSSGQLPMGVEPGWLTYLSRRRGAIPPLPEPVRVEPVEDKGALIILTPERVTASNPAHVALAKQVQRILGEAGMLEGL